MKRQRSQLTLVLGVALLATAQTARAGVCTGQPDGTTCDAGADHAYTMICVSGACIPCTADLSAAPQFVDNGDGTITDRDTCLVWEKKDNAGGIHDLNNVYQWSSSGSAMDGSAFTVFVAGLNSAAFAGHQDWRLPTAAGNSPATGQPAEAESIEVNVACGPTEGACMPAAFNSNCGPYSATDPPAVTTSNPGCTVDGAPGTQECSCAPFYHSWTASTVGGSSAQAWLECYTVTANGLSSPDKTNLYNVRAVRGGAASAITCSPTPLGGCLTPGTSAFSLASDPLDHGKDRLRWSWNKGVAVTSADIGDPTATTEYAVCVYAGNALLAQATAPSGGFWQALNGTPPGGYRYTDHTATNGGITKAEVITGAPNTTKAVVIGKGANLPFVSLPLLPSQLPVTVQLVNNNATPQCWTANYANQPKKNVTKSFKVKLP